MGTFMHTHRQKSTATMLLRYMEVQRLYSVLDQHLADKKYLCGDEYTIADMICMPWFHVLRDKEYMHP